MLGGFGGRKLTTLTLLVGQYPVGTRVLYTHKKYSISYNGPHIIHVNLTYSDVLTSIASNKCVQPEENWRI